ncbi:MAG TPA: hypothetical protein VFY31_03285 [Macromonas sp.]|nr:hypothetical protein [Macromonas sp.]
MFAQAVSSGSSVQSIASFERAPEFQTAAPELYPSEYLPFTVRVASDEESLQKAVDIRHAAYARHIDPKLAEALRKPEAQDRAPGTYVLLAESKLDGSPLGTMRIQTNEFKPLSVEKSVQLPDWMQGRQLAETTRLGVTNEKVGSMVKTVLVKAGYLFCVKNDIPYMVITARSPVDRQYDRLLFKDVFPDGGFIPLEHVFNLPHRVMYFDVFGGEDLWSERRHPLLTFMRYTQHPDIHLGDHE